MKNRGKVESLLKDFEKSMEGDETENALVITEDGKVFRCFGTKDQVFPDFDLGEEKLQNAIVYHNHVESETQYSFGDDDFSTFSSSGIRELKGFDEKYRYTLSKSDLTVDQEPEDWTKDFQHSKIIMKAKQYGYGYKRELR